MAEIRVNARGLQCPGPIVKLFQACKGANVGDVIVVEATDPGFKKDVEAWCRKIGNHLLSLDEAGGVFVAKVEKVS